MKWICKRWYAAYYFLGTVQRFVTTLVLIAIGALGTVYWCMEDFWAIYLITWIPFVVYVVMSVRGVAYRRYVRSAWQHWIACNYSWPDNSAG